MNAKAQHMQESILHSCTLRLEESRCSGP